MSLATHGIDLDDAYDPSALGPVVVAVVGAAVGDGDAALLQAATAMIETNPTASQPPDGGGSSTRLH